jgi:uncharacterized oxidoreductase
VQIERRILMNMTGNTILMTGGSSGIGQALAVALHTSGNQVIITGRRQQALEETVAAHPGMAFRVLDIMDAAAIRTFATDIVRDYPALNVLINNAGIMKAEDMLADPVDLTQAEAMIATNLLGPIRLTAALLPHLRARVAATVINVSSGLAFVPLAVTPTYSATKGALHSWSQSLRHQVRNTGVQVIELAPPAVATDLMPGSRANPNAMVLADYIAESMALLQGDPGAEEILVEKVRLLRNAEKSAQYGAVFGMLNPAG